MSLQLVTWFKAGALSTTRLNQFWQDTETGAFDPEIPNLPLELQTLTASLAATESSDTAAFNVSLSGGTITASFAVTETSDTVAITGSNRTTASLAATETSDTVAITGSNVTTASLAATETSDTVSISGSNRTTASLAATETSDTVAIAVSVSAGATITVALAATESSDTASFNVAAASDVPVGGGHAWKGPIEPEYRVHPGYEEKKPKKKRVRKEGQQVILAGEPEIQTGVIEVTPAWDALGELQNQRDEAEKARLRKLRQIALADDEWLMVA